MGRTGGGGGGGGFGLPHEREVVAEMGGDVMALKIGWVLIWLVL